MPLDDSSTRAGPAVMKGVKVLHVHTLPVISGSGLNTFLSMCGQRDAGMQVELACAPNGRLIQLVEQAGMRVRQIPSLCQPIHPWQDLQTVRALRRLCRDERYTIVHTHNSKAGFVGRLAARWARTPVIIHTVHGFAFHAQEPWWRRRLFVWLERLASRWCDQLIMISQPLIDWAVAERIATREHMVKIYSGIDVDQFRQPSQTQQMHASWGWPREAIIVGEVAKLWPGKGQAELLQAFARCHPQVPHARLVFIGEGPEQARLERLAARLGIASHVRFAGFTLDVPSATHALDVAVLPSLFEGMGRTVVEAMACGKPVIASRVGGIPDVLPDGVAGMLVPPGDVEQLANALTRLLRDPDLRARMGQAGHHHVTGELTAAVMIQEILSVYRARLQDGPS